MNTASYDLTQWRQWVEDNRDDPQLQAGCRRVAAILAAALAASTPTT